MSAVRGSRVLASHLVSRISSRAWPSYQSHATCPRLRLGPAVTHTRLVHLALPCCTSATDMSATPKSIAEFKVVGLITAPPTPFKENGDIDPDKIATFIDHLMLPFGVKNAFAVGSTGEGHLMTVEERKVVMKAWMTHGKDKLDAIIMHVGTGNLRESQELARYAQEIGASAIACVGPTYFKPKTTASYVDYMQKVAAAAPQLPFYLYDIDFVTGITLSTSEFFHHGKDRIPTLRGIKHTSPNLIEMHEILRHYGDRFQVMMGSDELFLEGLSIGLESSVCSSVLGNVLNRVKAAFDKGDMATARKEQMRALAFCAERYKQGCFGPSMLKMPAKALGHDLGQAREPFEPFTDEQVENLKEGMKKIGYYDWGLNP